MQTRDGRLPEALARSLAARGFHALTPVQRAVLAAGPGGDMLVSAPTGSGKTIAFGLALAPHLIGPDGFVPAGAPRALVVTPTRELALQVAGELGGLYGDTGARIGCCIGGVDMAAERAALAAGLDVVVGSPGRLRDHLARGALVAVGVGCVVLDEADDMLDLGFRDDLEAILDAVPGGRRILMFSATVTPRIEGLARRYQERALRIEVADGPAKDVDFQAVVVVTADRERAIVNLLRLHEARAAIVFCGRRDGVRQLAGRLAVRGFRVAALSGALSQRDRSAALAAMRAGRARVCVATDVAARGLDLPGLELVVHADLPASPAALLHRSGRTGRAGRRGLVVLVVPPAQRRRAETLAARAGLALDWVLAPGREAVEARDLERMVSDPALAAPADAVERVIAAGLLAAHAPERIATAFGRLWRGSRPRPEELSGGA
jgi:ATP-dependent RNA helicase DeaD